MSTRAVPTLDPAKLRSADETLVVGLARTGDRTAFAELVSRRQHWLRTLFRRMGADAPLADDLAQQTFLLAFKNISKIKEPSKFPGWLKTTALNVWRMHWRAQSRPEPIELHAGTEPGQHESQPGLVHDLEQALTTLPMESRSCVVLAYYEGMSHHEIATTLAIPLGTVKSHISRASAKLREQLADYLEKR